MRKQLVPKDTDYEVKKFHHYVYEICIFVRRWGNNPLTSVEMLNTRTIMCKQHIEPQRRTLQRYADAEVYVTYSLLASPKK